MLHLDLIACPNGVLGQHYWYNVKSDMNCDDFFPYFLLYNDGKLSGFGFAITDSLKSQYVEYVPNRMCGVRFFCL